MKRERQVKIYLGIIIIIFVLMTFLLPLGKSTKDMFNSFNNKVNIPVGSTITFELDDLKDEVTSIINRKYIVIYKDGLNETIFKTEIYYDCKIESIPKFKGNTNRSNYKFIGWLIEKEKDKIIYTASWEKSS